MDKPALQLLEGEFAIHRLAPDAPLPAGVADAPFCWIGRTDEELSVVCEAGLGGISAAPSGPWSALRAVGPLPLSATGVLAGLSAVLAAARIPMFALSTHDTDYLLVPTSEVDRARYALALAGYRLRRGPGEPARPRRAQ